MLTAELLLHHIEASPQQRVTVKQLLRELKVRGPERQQLNRLLQELVQSHRVLERRHMFTLAPAAGGDKRARRSEARGGKAQGARPAAAHERPTRVAAAGAPRRPAAAIGAGEVNGRIYVHRDGFGFVTPEKPVAGLDGDIFIPPPALGGALHGDRVAVRLQPAKAGGEGRREGAVAAVLGRRHTTLVGTFHRDSRGDYVQPIDDRVHLRVMIPPGAEAVLPAEAGRHRVGAQAAAGDELEGMIVEVELTSFPAPAPAPAPDSRHRRRAGAPMPEPARGRVLDVLGRRDDFGVDVEIMIRKHHLPHRFPEPVLEQARALAASTGAAVEMAARQDFRALPIVTIDGETARDFDDAVHVARTGKGRYALQVHIADVAHYVTPGSDIDAEARLRGTSVYFPDRAVPMLPVELSTDLCSLVPHQDRLVMSCLMEIDGRGEVVDYHLTPGIIRSVARMTYTQVNAVLENDVAARLQFDALASQFELMAELQGVLYGKRQRRGSIDFDLPEPEIAFDELGLMRSIVKSERNLAHRLIEEFMLAAAETVARHMRAAGWASVYRIHEQPDLKKVAEFEELAASFGHSLGLGALPIRKMRVRGRVVEVPEPGKFEVHPRNYQKLTERIAGRPEERMLSFLMLRSLKQARYSAHNAGHFALATDCYTHFTSPIRRYPDLLLHRLLKAQLGGAAAPAGLGSEANLESLCREASEAERRADEAERELMEWKKVRYMEQRMGEEFEALIIHVTRQGFYLELTDLFIEGFVPSTSLEDDDYVYLDASHEWVGQRRRRKYRLGGTVQVMVDRIDPVRQQIHFAPVGAVASGRRGRR